MILSDVNPLKMSNRKHPAIKVCNSDQYWPTNLLRRFVSVFLLAAAVSGLSGCFEKRTENAEDAFTYWAGAEVPKEVQVLHGQYWQSAHWTREYIMFLHLKTTDLWWNEYVKKSKLVPDDAPWTKPADAPAWFEIPAGFEMYRLPDDWNDSRVFHDRKTGESFIYEIQL